jgi:uncharacterized protein YebE (UPF0316 family)
MKFVLIFIATVTLAIADSNTYIKNNEAISVGQTIGTMAAMNVSQKKLTKDKVTNFINTECSKNKRSNEYIQICTKMANGRFTELSR